MITEQRRPVISFWLPAAVLGIALAAAPAALAWQPAGPVRGPIAARPDGDGVFGGTERSLLDPGVIQAETRRLIIRCSEWYIRTPPGGRMCWGGLLACGVLGLVVLVERMFRLRRRRIIPPDFTARFLDRLNEGKLDGGKALDYCEMNPSPAARVALAAVRRWGRPAVDLERAVSMAHHVEAERLRRNVGTLRRIAIVAPLIGLLGTLSAVGRVVEASAVMAAGPGAWGPALSGALSYLIVGITIATLAIVAYDALWVRIERLSGSLDRLGAETIDVIAMATPDRTPTLMTGGRFARPHGTHPEIPRPAFAAVPAAAVHGPFPEAERDHRP